MILDCYFGPAQRRLMHALLYEKKVIRVTRNNYEVTTQIELQDDNGDNTYEAIDKRMFSRFIQKPIFDILTWQPCLYIDITTIRLKHELIEALKLKIPK